MVRNHSKIESDLDVTSNHFVFLVSHTTAVHTSKKQKQQYGDPMLRDSYSPFLHPNRWALGRRANRNFYTVPRMSPMQTGPVDPCVTVCLAHVACVTAFPSFFFVSITDSALANGCWMGATHAQWPLDKSTRYAYSCPRSPTVSDVDSLGSLVGGDAWVRQRSARYSGSNESALVPVLSSPSSIPRDHNALSVFQRFVKLLLPLHKMGRFIYLKKNNNGRDLTGSLPARLLNSPR